MEVSPETHAGRLALGSAQFGMHYGVMNQGGQAPLSDVARILQIGKAAGIDLIDTAVAYGDSESVLGQVGLDNWRVVTKVPVGFEHHKISLEELVVASLERLGVESLYGLLAHDASMLFGEDGEDIINSMRRLQEAGLVRKVGASIYDPEILDQLMNEAPINLVQAPLNLIDQRMLSSGWLKKLKSQGIEFHARSIFLQGLLLTSTNNLPASFGGHISTFENLENWRNQNGLEPIAAALGFVLGCDDVDVAVIGVDSATQLEEILHVADSFPSFDASQLASTDLSLIDPRRWN